MTSLLAIAKASAVVPSGEARAQDTTAIVVDNCTGPPCGPSLQGAHQINAFDIVICGIELRWLSRADAWMYRTMAAHLREVMALAANLLAWTAFLAIHPPWSLQTQYILAWDIAAGVLAALHLWRLVKRLRTTAEVAEVRPVGRWFVRTALILSMAASISSSQLHEAINQGPHGSLHSALAVSTILVSSILLMTIVSLHCVDRLTRKRRTSGSIASSMVSGAPDDFDLTLVDGSVASGDTATTLVKA